MNDVLCMKQVRSPALWFRSDLIQLMAETCRGFMPTYQGTSLVARMVKRLPTMRETRVQSLGQEGLLEKDVATHSSIFAGKPHGWRILVGYSPWGHKESGKTERLD